MKNLILTIYLVLFITALNAQTIILHGNRPTNVELIAANDLKTDIQKVHTNELVKIQNSKTSIRGSYDKIIVIGTKQSNKLINKVYSGKRSDLLQDELEAETFVLQTLPFKGDASSKALYIIGADDRGTYYGIYEFSNKILGIDPLA